MAERSGVEDERTGLCGDADGGESDGAVPLLPIGAGDGR